MKVGWLVDSVIGVGGAELTEKEFREAAPEGVQVIDCPAQAPVDRLDAYVIHNCVSYPPEELCFDVPTFKYWHDVGPHLAPEQRRALSEAKALCCSPLQAEKMGIDAIPIPPAVPLDRFRKAAENAGERHGAVAVGPWRNPDKGYERAATWAKGNGGLSFIGAGLFAPQNSVQVDYEEMPETLARFKTFVHLPSVLEPFGRSTVEAWAAGCEVVVNSLVGGRYWITEAPEKLETAAEDFWACVLDS